MKKREKKFLFVVFSSKTIRFAVVVFATLALFLASVGTQSSISASFVGVQNKKLPIYCVENSSKQIALTFDAAWGSDKTSKILEVLKKHNIPATFFLVGFWVDKNQDLVKQIDAQGLEIGTHSNTHADFTKLSASQMNLELSTSAKKIEEIISKKVKYFRAPFGAYNNSVLQVAENLNLQTIQWDVDSLDWKGISAQKIVQNVITKVQSGSIVLCHNNADNIVEALPNIICALKSRGFEFVRVGDLVLKNNFAINHAGKQTKLG